MTDTTQPHPEPSQEASRITDYLSSGGLFNPELANHDAVRELLIDCRTQLQEQALQYLSDNGQWIEETGRLRAERDVLKAALVVGIEAIMVLADDYAENKSSLDLAGTECWRSALYIERKAAQSDAARSSLRAALEARKP